MIMIDEIAEPEFAERFREGCKGAFEIDPPKKIKLKSEVEYPEYITFAVDWWTNAITSSKNDNSEELGHILAIFSFMRKNKECSAESVKKFKKILAKGIAKQIKKYGYCSLDVDDNPCQLLREAGNELKLNSTLDLPWKTHMRITPNKVEVSSGYRATSEIIWKK